MTPRESFDHERGGCHHYPERDTVLHWLAGTRLTVVEEGVGDWYWPLLLRPEA